MRILQVLLRHPVELLLYTVLRKNLCQLRKHLTEIFCWLCRKVSNALGMLSVWRAVYWILLVLLATEEWLMKLVFEEWGTLSHYSFICHDYYYTKQIRFSIIWKNMIINVRK